MENGAVYGILALVVSAVGTLFAYIANKDKNKNEGANVVIGGYDKLYEDVRSELDRKNTQLKSLRERYEALQFRYDDAIVQNKDLKSLGERLEKQIAKLTEEISILQAQLPTKDESP